MKKSGFIYTIIFCALIALAMAFGLMRSKTDNLIREYANAFPGNEAFCELMNVKEVSFYEEYLPVGNQYTDSYLVEYIVEDSVDSYIFGINCLLELKGRTSTNIQMFKHYEEVADQTYQTIETSKEDIKMYFIKDSIGFDLFALMEDDACKIYYLVDVKNDVDYNDEFFQEAINDAGQFLDYIKENK